MGKNALTTEVEVTKKKIHRLAYIFSIDFSLLGLAFIWFSFEDFFLAIKNI
jgi:hypothetical protein